MMARFGNTTIRSAICGALLTSLALPVVYAQAQQSNGVSQPPNAVPSVTRETAKPQEAESNIDPKVIGILRSACDVLSAARTMTFTATDTYERAARNGQPLYYSVRSQVTLQRPDKLRVLKIGDGVPDEFYYDGKTISAYVPSANVIATADAPPTLDKMLDAVWDIAAIYFPFADMMVSEPCAVFDKNLTSAFYIGRSVVVGGTTTDMVAVAGQGVQAQLWIGTDDHLPRMVRVVYVNEPARALPDRIFELEAWRPRRGIGLWLEQGRYRKADSICPAGRHPISECSTGREVGSGPVDCVRVNRQIAKRHFMKRLSWVASFSVLLLMVSEQPGSAFMRGGGGGGGGFHGGGGGNWSHNAGGGVTHSGDMGGGQHSTSFSSSGVSHSSNVGGFEHGTAANSQGVSHASNAGGFEHGTTASSQGLSHSSDAGGYYHGTSASGGTVEHTGWNGTTTESYGSYYHQPATVNYYGASGCYNCGGGGWGYAAAGAAVGLAVGATAAAASANAVTTPYNAGVAAASTSTAAAYNAGVAAGLAAKTSQPVTIVASQPPMQPPHGATFAALPDGCKFEPVTSDAYFFCPSRGGFWLMPAYGANGLYYQVVAAP
jgi:hypothetical protein